jgi:hypothetical protein
MKKRKWVVVAVALNLVTFLLPVGAQAAEVPLEELPTPLLVEEPREALLARGCVEKIAKEGGLSVEAPEGAWQQVAARDWVAGKYMFCPEGVAGSLTGVEGEVLFFNFGAAGVAAAGATFTLSDLYRAVTDIPEAIFSILMSLMAWLTALLIVTPILYVLQIVSGIVGLLLTQQSFVNNEWVSVGFPIILSLVNVLFLAILLAMATMVILRVERFDLKRALPRLIISALLVNFSLVIAGVAIDASRLLMAATATVAGGGGQVDINNLGYNFLVNQTAFISGYAVLRVPVLHAQPQEVTVQNALTSTMTATIARVAKLVFSLLFALIILMGWVVFGIVLIIRAVALILLLIVAPVPYLVWSFPFTEKFAGQWWNQFIKYVFLGPALFFIIVLIGRVSTPPPVVANHIDIALLVQVMLAGIMPSALLIVGGLGALKISGFSAKQVLGGAKKGLGFAARHPVLAGTALAPFTSGGSLLAGLAGKAGKRVGQNVGDAGREASAAFGRTGFGKFIRGPARDEKTGKLKAGQSSYGKRRMDKFLGADKDSRQISDTLKSGNYLVDGPDKTIATPTGYTTEKTKQFAPTINLKSLSDQKVMDSLSGKELDKIFEEAGKVDGGEKHRRLILQNKSAMKKMKGENIAKAMAGDFDTPMARLSEVAERTQRAIAAEAEKK